MPNEIDRNTPSAETQVSSPADQVENTAHVVSMIRSLPFEKAMRYFEDVAVLLLRHGFDQALSALKRTGGRAS
jgi:hypothetical protein